MNSINPVGRSLDLNLEDIYSKISHKQSLLDHYSKIPSNEIDNVLLSESVSPLEEEVIEELFGKTKAKLAGAGANIGARAANLKNKVATGASNIAQKTGAVAGNLGKGLKQGVANVGNVAMGQQPQQVQGLVDPSQVGNQTAEYQDPNAAANAAKLQAILPDIKKSIGSAYKSIDNNLGALGLDAETLNQINPEVAQAIKYAKGWLKAAYTKLG